MKKAIELAQLLTEEAGKINKKVTKVEDNGILSCLITYEDGTTAIASGLYAVKLKELF